jgi:hypothetical protein
VVGVLTNPLEFRHCWCLAKRHQQYLPFFFSLLSFSLDEKETKNQDHQKLPTRLARRTARISDVSEVRPRSPQFKHLFIVDPSLRGTACPAKAGKQSLCHCWCLIKAAPTIFILFFFFFLFP